MSMTNKLVLGTVQFGLDYGINNHTGKLLEEEVFVLLDNAWENGIRYLDSADSYGNAGEIIGKYHRNRNNRFNVLTKFKMDSFQQSIFEKVNNSLKILGIEKLYCYSYHSFNDYINYPEIIYELVSLKRNGIIKKIGISIYSNEEFSRVIDSNEIDVIQIPYNVLDNDNLRGQLIRDAKKRGKEIHSRSVFLQGLFFINHDHLPEKLRPLNKYLKLLNEFAIAEGLSISAIALNFVIHNPLIDSILVGVDNVAQLLQNISIIDAKYYESINRFASAISVSEINLLNPVNWK